MANQALKCLVVNKRYLLHQKRNVETTLSNNKIKGVEEK
jgi:hypothetical protein